MCVGRAVVHVGAMGVSCRCVPPMMLKIVLAFLFVWNPVSALVRFKDPKDAVTETATVHLVVSSDRHFTARERREAGGMPSFLQFNVSMDNGNNLELRLWRTPRTDQPFPVHVMRDGKLTEISVTHDMEWGIYDDPKTKASMLIHRPTPGAEDFMLNGILQHGKDLMQLRPHYEAPESWSHRFSCRGVSTGRRISDD